jgi:hypothetical protein
MVRSFALRAPVVVGCECLTILRNGVTDADQLQVITPCRVAHPGHLAG